MIHRKIRHLLEVAYKAMLYSIMTNRDTEKDIEVTLPYGKLVVNNTFTYATLTVNEEYLLPSQVVGFVDYRISITGIVHEHHQQLTSKKVIGDVIPVITDCFIPIPYHLWIRYGIGEFRQMHANKPLFEMEHVFDSAEELHTWIDSNYDTIHNSFRHLAEQDECADPLIYRIQRLQTFTKYNHE